MTKHLSLYLDTSGDVLRFHLEDSDGKAFTYQEDITQQRTHSALLVPLLKEGLQTLDAQVPDIATIYTNIGPGSFTGLRASLTLVRALAQFVPDMNIYGIPHFACTLGSLSDETLGQHEHITIALDARRKRAYVQEYAWESGKVDVKHPPDLFAIEDIHPSHSDTLFITDSQNASWDATIDANHPPDLATHSWAMGMQRAVNLLDLSPTRWRELDALYLQAPSITLSDKMKHISRNL
jgi:tRNA threonylcarbamoyl adenosine modification protein YeaZ